MSRPVGRIPLWPLRAVHVKEVVGDVAQVWLTAPFDWPPRPHGERRGISTDLAFIPGRFLP